MIGSTVWLFDENRRVYTRGGSVGRGPIWREHWAPRKIVGETSRSWVTEYGDKVPKRGCDPRCVAFSRDEIERQAYIHENAHKIGEAVRCIGDYELLRKVAELIGYSERIDKAKEPQ